MTQNTFNITRFSQFLLRQGTLNIQPLLIAIGGIFGILMLISFLTAYFNPGDLDNMIPLYLVVFFISGFIFTSRVFSELNTPQRSYFFLTLPVSTFEKVLGSWILCSPIYSLFYLAIVSVIFFFSALIAQQPIAFVEIFRAGTFHTIGAYMVIQTVFFLGACAFRNYNFVKTLFTLFIIAVGLAAFSATVGGLLFYGHFKGDFNDDAMGGDFPDTAEYIFTKVIPFIFWYLLGPFLLIVSYFKLKERQA
jgi:hypothetical protein